MKKDLPNYLNTYASDEVRLCTMKKIVMYNEGVCYFETPMVAH